ncbi:MAG: membrane protein insertase YidC [Planctomycetota bacterium]|nr:membrane protein insertase YidC [Planctomycetota bacterium]
MSPKLKKILLIAALMVGLVLYYSVFMRWVMNERNSGSPSASPAASESAEFGTPVPTGDGTPVASGTPAPQDSLTPAPTPSHSLNPTPTQTPTPVRKDITNEKISSNVLELEFTTDGGAIASSTFLQPDEELKDKGFRDYDAPADTEKQMRLLSVLQEHHTSFRLLLTESDDPADLSAAFEDPTDYEIKVDETEGTVSFFGEHNGLRITKIFKVIAESYEIELDVTIQNISQQSRTIGYLIVGAAGVVPEGIENKRKTLRFNYANLMTEDSYYMVDDEKASNLPEDGSYQFIPHEDGGKISWVATSSHFFSVFLKPNRGVPVAGAFAGKLLPESELVEDLATYDALMENIEGGIVVEAQQLWRGRATFSPLLRSERPQVRKDTRPVFRVSLLQGDGLRLAGVRGAPDSVVAQRDTLCHSQLRRGDYLNDDPYPGPASSLDPQAVRLHAQDAEAPAPFERGSKTVQEGPEEAG